MLCEPPNIDPELAFPSADGVPPNKDPGGELTTVVEDAAFALPPNKEVECVVAPPPNIKPCGFVALSKIEPVEAVLNVVEEVPLKIDVFVVDGTLLPKTVFVLLPPKTEAVDTVDGVDIVPKTEVFEELLNGIGVDVIAALSKILVTEETDVVAGN